MSNPPGATESPKNVLASRCAAAPILRELEPSAVVNAKEFVNVPETAEGPGGDGAGDEVASTADGPASPVPPAGDVGSSAHASRPAPATRIAASQHTLEKARVVPIADLPSRPPSPRGLGAETLRDGIGANGASIPQGLRFVIVFTSVLATRRAILVGGMNRLHFEVARSLASTRVVWDLLRTVVSPPADGSPMAASSPTTRPGTSRVRGVESLRVLSWNVHRGYRAAEALRSLERLMEDEDPDLLLLQEVPVHPSAPLWEWDGYRQLLADLHLAYAPMHHVHRRTTYYPFETSGQLTASRVPFRSVEVFALPRVSRPKLGPDHRVDRVALYTGLDAGERRVGVLNVHLENTTRPSGRAIQARAILQRVRQLDDETLLVGGDLNTVFRGLEEAGRVLEEAGFSEAPPASRRLIDLDRFFVRGAAHCAPSRRLDASGSDHLPVATEIALVDGRRKTGDGRRSPAPPPG